ncbi:sugar ABC transporter substrate-binding protein [Bacillus sp. J14TS2]|uniref:ABC transporter substrate-binding protein n=1 Tax=Bacillus sp. J14TS2 TaxID=2807188 RepID=UPI001B2B48C1|nr:extracellular solute-binding protein [Bacillus sp. J14TS2]GIN72284.1 sugar ABC transporter substrate-binding protein [Bacillus sp. J14TS2]
MKKVGWLGVLFILLVTVSMAGCQNEEVGNETKEIGKDVLEEPVTITIMGSAMMVDDDMIDEFFKPIIDKYPNVSLKATSDSIEDMVAAGKVPDMIITSNPSLYDNIEKELAGDMSEFFESQNIDLSRFNPAIVEDLAQHGEVFDTPDAIYAMPLSLNYGVLMYNKDIFDTFGVDYPEAGITWDDVIDLARKTTGMRDGIEYIGLDPGWIHELFRAHSLSYVDDNGQVDLMTDGFKEVMDVFDQAYSIPGMIGQNEENYGYGGMGIFIEERRLAMFPAWVTMVTENIPLMEESGLNWDITSFPTFTGTPEFGRNIDYHAIIIPETAENREAALHVAAEMVTEEAQLYLSKEVNRVTVLDNPEIRESYATGSNAYEGKHLQDIFTVDPSLDRKPSPYNQELDELMMDLRRKLAVENKDVNTILREAQEEAETLAKEFEKNH